jgi:hypothetical protein
MARRGEGCERLRDRKDYEITEVARRSSRYAPNSRHVATNGTQTVLG